MRLGHGLAPGAVLVTAAVLSAPASAQYVSGRFSLTAGATYTRVISDAAFPSALTPSGPALSLGPSGTLLVDTPRTSHVLLYSFTLGIPFTQQLEVPAGALAYTNRTSYTGRFQLTERDTLTLTGNFTHAPARAIVVAGDASETPIDPTVAGATYNLSAGAQEAYAREVSEVLTFTQSAGVMHTSPIDPINTPPRTTAFSLGFALARRVGRDTFGVQASGMLDLVSAQGSAAGVIDARAPGSGALAMTWARPLGEAFSVNAGVGIAQVVSPTSDPRRAGQLITAVGPTATLTLAYQLDLAVATLSYTHGTAPNLVTGSINFTDGGALRFTQPILDTGLSAAGSAGFTRMTPIDALEGTPMTTYLGDVSLTYRPPAVPTLTLTARGQAQRQVGGADPVSSYTRLSGTFSLSWSWPRADAAQVTPFLPPPSGAMSMLPGAPVGPSRPFEASPDEPPAPVVAPPAGPVTP